MYFFIIFLIEDLAGLPCLFKQIVFTKAEYFGNLFDIQLYLV